MQCGVWWRIALTACILYRPDVVSGFGTFNRSRRGCDRAVLIVNLTRSDDLRCTYNAAEGGATYNSGLLTGPNVGWSIFVLNPNASSSIVGDAIARWNTVRGAHSLAVITFPVVSENDRAQFVR